MKIKKIILSMVSILFLAIVFMSQTVFAVDQGSWTFTEISVDSQNPYKGKIYRNEHDPNDNNPEFILNFDGTNAGKVVTQIGDENGNKLLNYYCAMASQGFELRQQASWSSNGTPYKDTYNNKYNMNEEKAAVQSQNMYRDNNTYKGILALADLFYLGNSENDLKNYIKPLLYGTDNTSGPMYFSDYDDKTSEELYNLLKISGNLITDNQIRAVQQVALWYFTDGIDFRDRDENIDLLSYRFQEGGYNSLNDFQKIQVIKLYKYLINTAKTNAANSNYKNLNTVYLYLDNTTDDEQPIIEIIQGKGELDLALRKYITKVGSTNVTNRIPNIVTTNLDNGTKTTAEYKHRKDPVVVTQGQNVTYTLTVYNEGEIKGKATEIVDQLPTGVVFNKNATESIAENSNYTFTYDSTLNKVTIKDKRANTEGILNEYEGTLASASVQVVCTVTAEPDTDNEKIFTNVAWISKAYNASTAQEYTQADIDRDSAPGIYPNVNKDNMENYKGKSTNKAVTPADSNYHYEGEQDDDDFEKIVLKPQKFDLALRKFITKIADKNITNRIPQITGNTVEQENTTAEKTHPKNKLEVVKGDTVVYTIRVYNEGYKDGYASEVTDYLPEGLTLKANSTINITYGWTASGKIIKTTYLADKLLTAVNRDYTKFNENDAENKYYRDLQVECVVNNNATSNNLKNIAEITVAKDKNNNVVTDEDSTPKNVNKDNYNPKNRTKGLGEEDDDDFEDLKIVEFDLALRKYITKVEDKDGNEITISTRTPNIDKSTIPTTATYKHRKDPVVVKPGYFVYYDLTVYNEGDIDGYAKTITDQLPTGVKFIEVVNASTSKYAKKSYDQNSNVLVLERKENQGTVKAYNGTTLNSETVTIKCEVIADKETGSDKIYTNIAWISEDYNEKGATDRDSKPVEHPDEDELVTNYPDNGYINERDNANKDLSNSNEYFKGEQDDDDFEKIIIYKGPVIHKGVKTVKNQDSGYDEDVTKPHEWVINSSLPLNIKDYKKYEIVDDIDYRLVYGEVKSVKIIDKDGNTVTELEEGENKDYILKYTENTSNNVSQILGNKYSGTLTLTFIDINKTISNKVKANGGNIIEVKFTTTFAKDENGKLLAEIIGNNIPNKAELEYDNGFEQEKIKTEKPEVHTGGITLYKYETKDGKKVGLKDAEFKIFKTEEDAIAKQNAVQIAKSDKNGLVKFVGLEYGEDAKDSEENKKADGTYIQGTEEARVIPGTNYWIVETKAPKGYKTIEEPFEVTINNDSYKDEIEVLIREEESKETSNRLIENKPLNFDLALRKFITAVNDKATKVSREPVVDVTSLKEGTATTATYTHPKDPVDVVNGDVVSYSLRIYNEGQIDGYASIVTDDIPEGLEFLPEHNTNKEYRWVMYEELKEGTEVADEDKDKVVTCKVNGESQEKQYIETKDAKKAVIIRTDYLSKEQGEERMQKDQTLTENPNLLKAFDGDKLDYKDLKLVFRVTEPNGSKRVLINYAQISEDKDEDGNDVTDIDSTPNIWNEGEDDQDIEKLIVPNFDLALRKWVTQAIVIENGQETVTNTGHDAWDDPEEIVKVELHRKKLSNVTVKFRYSIRVYNQGELEGYAKEIKDYIPEGLKFVAEDNPSWKDEGNNIITTRALENTLLKPGEYADVEVLLTWINGKDNLGLKVNTAEISEDYNEKGVPDCDSVPDNKKPGEDDIDDAPVMLSISTGMEATYIVLGTSILVILAGGIFLIKKYVL